MIGFRDIRTQRWMEILNLYCVFLLIDHFGISTVLGSLSVLGVVERRPNHLDIYYLPSCRLIIFFKVEIRLINLYFSNFHSL